jgi:myo-inositol 2-dehydrogenase / D-chiro-inositol 1-dehydrogenase
MIHEFDLAAWFFAPARVLEIYAAGSAIIDPALSGFGDADTTVASLRFDSGALGSIDGAREALYGYDVRAELVGSKGMFLAGYERLPNGKVLDAAALTPDVESFAERFADAYRAELASFLDTLGRGGEPAVGGADALEALRLATAATRSFQEGRPVLLSEIPNG